MTALGEWESFYVIVGSSAGALIGLQFVVITLIAERPRVRDDVQANKAFITPSVVHFAVVLLLSALASAPWHGIGIVAVLWGLVGLGGIVYVIVIGRRVRAQTAYEPVFEDSLFHVLLPQLAYALLAGSACAAYWHPRPASFGVGAATLLLLFVGIHNAWDVGAYQIFTRREEDGEGQPDSNRVLPKDEHGTSAH